MSRRLALLHTSPLHRAGFDALRDAHHPGAQLTHHLRADWLDRVRAEGETPTLAAEIAGFIAGQDAPVLCTCTSLGPMAGAGGAMRIDAPMMARAAKIGGRIGLAYALPSTLAPSRDLLAAQLSPEDSIAEIDLTAHWPLFEAGRAGAFAETLATALRARCQGAPALTAIVLAQASMAGVAPLLADLPVPVLASPTLALSAALGQG